MPSYFSRLNDAFLAPAGLPVTRISPDPESTDYEGHILECGAVRIQFRKAKVTPKKAGHFVALWKRGASGETLPFDITDPFDYYLIAVEEGIFFFPKSALGDNGVLSGAGHEGKRGFRLYAPSVAPPNPTARRAQVWQAGYFLHWDVTANQMSLRELLNQR